LLLTSEDGGLPGANLQIVPASATGAFTATAPAPGRYLVSALRVPAGWLLSGVTLDGQPLDAPIDLSGADVTGLTFTYTRAVASVGGALRAAVGGGSPNADVLVFPQDRRLWTVEPLNPREPRVEHSMDGETYVVSNLLPGAYFVAAVDSADVPETLDPEFFEAASRFASRVTLEAGQRASQDLTVGRMP
jgi:hypothetical protein